MSERGATATPVYAEKARIVNGRDLYRRAGASYDAIAALALCHANTVRDAVSGKSKQYQKAHDVFTALNSLLHNSYSRREYVHYLNDSGEFEEDGELDNTRVFPRLKELMAKLKLRSGSLAEQSGVGLLFVEEALRKKPVDESVQRKILFALNEMGASLEESEELIR